MLFLAVEIYLRHMVNGVKQEGIKITWITANKFKSHGTVSVPGFCADTKDAMCCWTGKTTCQRLIIIVVAIKFLKGKFLLDQFAFTNRHVTSSVLS